MRSLLDFRHLLVLTLALAFILPTVSQAQVAVSITVAPPVIPVYAQPACPVEGYLWTPGYWAWGPAGYYWVPGVWVAPPRVGLLWTPGYWGFVGGVYGWHAGYWGPHIGFYGGVNYGFGYGGVGFVGGVWRGSVFAYNTAVVHVDETVVRNVYVDRTVINNTTVVNRVSFNGPGGVMARPTAQEQVAIREQHFQPTQDQVSHQMSASHDRSMLASENHGTPQHAAFASVNQRQFNQQQRIANGIRSGQMTAGQAAHVEHQEADIHREVQNDRAANGGHLTPQEHNQVEHQQNNVSHEIYKDKHDEK
ncbi:MAG TPA: YXWGXW repeat-containing protein [Candidatus Acidoferrales bacterium]|nr:YXWGXW repeat-containing protein [Candidatus Acidoferrales bacterium]